MSDARDRVYPGGQAPLLAAAGISKRYGAVQALDGVVLTVGTGEIVALCGENGSGKSTLAKIIAGAVSPDSGEVIWEGRRHEFTGPQDALNTGIALVAQELTAVPEMSVAENVLLASDAFSHIWQRVRRSQLAEKAKPYLETVGLGEVDPLAKFSSLGPGDRELVEIAKALASEPRLLILDEVTARLPDPEQLFLLLERLRDEGISSVFITHRLREVSRLADRAVVLRDGHLVGEVARSEISDRRLSEMMVGREISEIFHKPSTTPGEEVLRLDGLVTGVAPDPITLSVRAGEIVGIGGLVGSGRSELLETIALARRPRGGSVLINGRPMKGSTPGAALSQGVALLPEDRHSQGLVLGASIERNIALVNLRAFALTDRQQERSAAESAVAELSIRAPDTSSPVATLSGGNQQKVVFARCLAGTPRVLLLDEPTRGVDIGAREEIYRLIGEAVDGGLAVMMVSSDMIELLGLSDRIVVLYEGRVAGQLDRDEATEEAIMYLAAGGSTAAG